ncbi:MAG: HNH endonuclease signature motif containing protein [Anaerolineales bacterium]|jgi:hypothetical protein
MSISSKDQKILLQKSGNRCAFPGCGESLLFVNTDDNNEKTVLSNIAHIVARTEDGPRGHYFLPVVQRDDESNLLLLCEKHHKIIDDQPQRYTVERLRQFKEDHEKLIAEATGQAIIGKTEALPTITESLYSTLFEITEMPALVYSAPTMFSQFQIKEIREKIVLPKKKSELYPYVIRNGDLYSFQNLHYRGGPFQNLVDIDKAKSINANNFWNDPVKGRWFVDLLNQTLNKLTGRKGLMLDKEHRRYYFQIDKPGEVKTVEYRPLNISKSRKQVVWQPISKKTTQPYPYWLHRAVNLKFHQVTNSQWCLSIRPEFRVTKDGSLPLVSDKIGSKVTRKKSKMFNYDLLGEVNFWRDFLSDSEPRIILNFGRKQNLIISTKMLQTEIEWPGIPEKYAKPFKNIDYQDDLFTWSKLANLIVDIESDEEEDLLEERYDGEE